jgi:hypothetical protein
MKEEYPKLGKHRSIAQRAVCVKPKAIFLEKTGFFWRAGALFVKNWDLRPQVAAKYGAISALVKNFSSH